MILFPGEFLESSLDRGGFEFSEGRQSVSQLYLKYYEIPLQSIWQNNSLLLTRFASEIIS